MRQHRAEAEGGKDLGLPHAGGAAAPRFEAPSATTSSEDLEELLAAGGAAGAGPGATQPRFRSAASPAQLAAIAACKAQPESAEERQLCSQELRPGVLQGPQSTSVPGPLLRLSRSATSVLHLCAVHAGHT